MIVQLELEERGVIGLGTGLHIHNFSFNDFDIKCSLFINPNDSPPCFRVNVYQKDKVIDDQRVYDSDAAVMQNHLDKVLEKYK